MLFLIFPTYCYIVKVCKSTLQLLFSYKVSHDPLKTCHSISYPKRYACKLIQCITCLKSSVWPVTLFDADLVVSTTQIDGTEDSGTVFCDWALLCFCECIMYSHTLSGE